MMGKIWGYGILFAFVDLVVGIMANIMGGLDAALVCRTAGEVGACLAFLGAAGVMTAEYKKPVTFDLKRARFVAFEEFCYYAVAVNLSVACGFAVLAALLLGWWVAVQIYLLGWFFAGLLATGFARRQGTGEPISVLIPLNLGLVGLVFGAGLLLFRRYRRA